MLDFFNDNHSKETTGIVGYPDAPAKYVAKGAMLPSGRRAPAPGHWVEGYLLGTEKAKELWELGLELQKTDRRLGLSVEGKVQKRLLADNKTVAEALVRNVAITGCPVNTDATLDMLVKSLQVVSETEPNELEKMLTMGTATPGEPPSPDGPVTGEGAGKVLATESLESDCKPDLEKEKKKKGDVKKSFNDSEAKEWFKARLPNATDSQLDRVLVLTRAVKRNGKS